MGYRPLVNRRYTKGVPYSCKMVYKSIKRVKGWIVEYPPPPPLGGGGEGGLQAFQLSQTTTCKIPWGTGHLSIESIRAKCYINQLKE